MCFREREREREREQARKQEGQERQRQRDRETDRDNRQRRGIKRVIQRKTRSEKHRKESNRNVKEKERN